VATLVIHGEGDLLPVDVARSTASLLPASRLAIVSGAGHMPYWEAPQHFFPLVESFLAEPTPAPLAPSP
jgi:pimeloyl-ACP methyl ester carboxylesterase